MSCSRCGDPARTLYMLVFCDGALAITITLAPRAWPVVERDLCLYCCTRSVFLPDSVTT